jgi:quinone-modifying oxidoreductase subunit QmoA
VRAACPEAEVSIHYIDRRAIGNYERFLAATDEDEKIRFVPGKVARVDVQSGNPVLEFEDVGAGRRASEPVDLVVLATGMVPERSGAAETCRLERDANGFWLDPQTDGRHFSAGCARQPMDVASAVRDATSAVARALATMRRRA